MHSSAADFVITTGRDGSRSFGEHDDRWAPQRGRYNNRRKFNPKGYSRGSFRGRGRGRGVYGNSGDGYRDFDMEGDFMMGQAELGPQRRYNPYGVRNKGRRGQYNQYQLKNNTSSNRSSQNSGASAQVARRLGLPVQTLGGRAWYKITIPQAKSVGKDTLLSLLAGATVGNFRPIQFQFQGEMAIFYVDDRDSAELLKSISKTLTVPGTDFKLILNVKPSSPPFPIMNEENVGKLKVVMSARYDPSVKSLDISALYEDKALQKEGLYLPLHRANIAQSVASIIKQNIPEVVQINASNNRMLSLSVLQEVVRAAPEVTALDLSRNQLRSVQELDKLKAWSLTQLHLTKNPLCDHFGDKRTQLVSAIRKRFPKLMKLDGEDLPPPITFDVSSSVLPSSLGSYFANDDVQELVVKFLKEYYTLYDSDNRAALVDAYHEQARFSLSAAPNALMEYKQPSLAQYFQCNRNDFRIKGRDETEKADNRFLLLKKTKLQVVAALCDLPKTTHDANSFVVDVNLLASNILSFVVNGLFKESENRQDKPPIRAFSRCFMAVPAASGGILVTNDSLSITNATSEQQQAAFKSAGPTPSSSPVSSNPPTLTPSCSAAAAPVPVMSPQQQLEALTPHRQQMVLAFSQQSTMNHIYSLRCLEENDWEYEKAGQVFLELQKDGKIPPEAFVK